MRTWQAVGLAAIVLLLVILVVAFVIPVRTETPPTQSPVTRPSPSASTAPPSTTAPTTAARSPTPTPIGLFVNETWKFSVVLPTPYRRSSRLSLENTGGQRPAAQDAFTARIEQDEAALAAQSCQTACPIWNFVAVVEVNTGAGSQTARQWYMSGGGATGERIEDITVDGRPAIRVIDGVPYPVQYIVKDGDRMFRIAYQIYGGVPAPAGATKDKVEAILSSFKFLP